MAGATLDPSSTTRTGAMGGGVGVGGGGADEKRGGGSGTVREKSVVPLGPRTASEVRGVRRGCDGQEMSARDAEAKARAGLRCRRAGTRAVATGNVGCGALRGAKLTCGAGAAVQGDPGHRAGDWQEPEAERWTARRGRGAVGGGGGVEEPAPWRRGRRAASLAPCEARPAGGVGRRDARREPLTALLAERQMARVVPAARRANHASAMGQRRAGASQAGACHPQCLQPVLGFDGDVEARRSGRRRDCRSFAEITQE